MLRTEWLPKIIALGGRGVSGSRIRRGRLNVGLSHQTGPSAIGTVDFLDVRDMRPRQSGVEDSRKKVRTKVLLLLVLPGDASDPSKRKNVELVLDEIKLKIMSAG